jgi:U6 snRNA-associated Sm-like protein LSm7
MSEQQPQPRGGFRGRGPRGDRGGRAGASSGRAGAQKSGGGDTERPKKENILDLSKYLNKALRVKFSGGREGMADRSLSLLLLPSQFS